LHKTEYHQTHDARTGGKPGSQIANSESDRAYGSFQGRAKNIKGENVEKQMGKPSMQEERREKPPVFSLGDNGIGVECADSMQNFGVVQVANGNLKKECEYVEQNQHENGWRASELAMADAVRD